jgi:hypothetical protein
MQELADERLIILTVTGVSLSPFVISSALILGDSDRIRWARKSTKYGLIVVIIAIAAFEAYDWVEVYHAREQARTFHEELFS